MRDPRCVRVPCLIRVSRPPTYILPQRKSGDLPTLSHLFSASYTSSLPPPFALPRSPSSSLGRPRNTSTVDTRRGQNGGKEREIRGWRGDCRGSDEVLEILAFTFGVDRVILVTFSPYYLRERCYIILNFAPLLTPRLIDDLGAIA